MATKSTHQIAIKGKDQTAGAFASIRGRAAAAGSSIGGIMRGAIAAAGAYLSVRSVAGAITNLGHLSDVAMKAGTSVEALTSTATAFQVAGLDIGVDKLAKAYQYMEKTTGRIGEDAFYETVQQISQIEDPLKRGNELMRTFGRSGIELQPLVNGGAEVVEKFRTLASLMPAVSTEAANAGDSVADAQTILGTGFSTMWKNAIGYVCQLWGDEFPGGVRAGALNAVNYVEYALKVIWNKMTHWGAKIGLAGQALWNWAANGYSWDQAWDEFGETSDILDSQMGAQLAEIDKNRADYKAKLATMDVDDLANAFGKRNAKAIGEDIGETAAKAAKKVTNTLIMGESNTARKLAMFGPEYQNEAKKQTKLLEKIAENTGDGASTAADLAEANLG